MVWKDAETRRQYDRRRRAVQVERGICTVAGCNEAPSVGRQQCARHLYRLGVNSLKKKYGLTPEQFASLMEAQQNACAICKTAPDRFHVDHDHETGVVRGLLCADCNKALGSFKDSAQTIEAALAYLHRSRQGGGHQ